MSEIINLRNPKEAELKQFAEEARKRRILRDHAERYKIIQGLLQGKEMDITKDATIFATLNQERLNLETYMECFKEECEAAAQYVKDRNSTDKVKRGGNKAWWRYKGSLPNCIHRLFLRVAPNEDDRKKLRDRFFENFPQFAFKETK